ncbi:sensor histidine kinase [Dactylosporangium sp. CA-233914]|uniref:sensor histidine kinase n=1 Tax=Dactylosporangium sp. CA-233914 TaxID=3239934 RepID=UPI003D91B84C
MTIYDARRTAIFRPTLRLRLTLLNGILLVGAGLVLVVLAYILVDGALKPADQLQPGTRVVLENGTETDARTWQTELVDSAEWELLTRGSLALLLIGAVGVAGAYVVAGRALRPLQRVTSTAQRLSGESLDARINYDGADDEVADLARTFDAMLDRIAAAFETQKRFVANASHELRTPLAVMRTEVDVTLDDPEADLEEYQRMATVVRDASMRANALVESLLLLARTEAQAGRRLGRKVGTDLATGVTVALSAMGKEVKRLKLDVSTDLAPANVVGDPALLERLAGNLIENAVRYNHLAGKIWVRTGTDETLAWLVVGNTGFEVEPADLPALFEPFRRGGRERTGARGTGLGLSIVRAVCEAHGGGVSAVALDGGGLEVTVSLPAAAVTPVLSGTASVRPAA